MALLLWWEDRPLRGIESSIARKNFDQALSLSDAYLREFPDRSRALQLKAQALTGLERWGDAARIFERVGGDDPESQRAWSQTLLHLKHWSEALPLLIELHKRFPNDAEILHELAACYGQLGEFEAGIEVAQELLTFPNYADRGRLLLGTLHERRGNHKLAAENWQSILASNPNAANLQIPAAEFLSAYGRALLNDGRADEAQVLLDRSLRMEETSETAAALGEACEQTGDAARAQQLWKSALARDSGNLKARNGLARAALEQNDPALALKWLNPVADRDDLSSATAYLFQRALTLSGDRAAATGWESRVAKLRDQEQRLSTIEQGLQAAPDAFWSRAVRAHRFASQGNLRQAAVLIERLLKERPDEPFVRQLAESLENKRPLPSFDLIPMKLF